MGCFASTCCISGLPLEEGDDVLYFLMTENRLDGSFCSVYERYVPRSLLIRAKYNNYGGIEDYDKNSPQVYSLVECFKKDLIEKGIGDNTIHDVAITKDSSFEEFMEALWEDRVEVMDHPPQSELNPDLPTMNSVKELLRNHFEGALVDEKSHGWVRVRSDWAHLEGIVSLLKERYAACITAGSGSYPNFAEVQVMPAARSNARWGEYSGNKVLKVRVGMISLKVWNGILENQGNKYKHIENHKERIFEKWDNRVSSLRSQMNSKRRKEHREALGELPKEEDEDYTKITEMLAEISKFSHDMNTAYTNEMGMGNHIDAVAERHIISSFSKSQIEQMLNDYCDFDTVMAFLMRNRYWLRPTYCTGPQFGEYRDHLVLSEIIGNICRERIKIQEEIDKEDQY